METYLDDLFYNLSMVSVPERLVIKQILDNFSVALEAEEEMLKSNSEDILIDRVSIFLESQFQEMAYLCETEEFEHFRASFLSIVDQFEELWPKMYIGDLDNEPHEHPGIKCSLMAMSNCLNLLKCIFSSLFGGFNGIPYLYGDEHEQLHNFSDN